MKNARKMILLTEDEYKRKCKDEECLKPSLEKKMRKKSHQSAPRKETILQYKKRVGSMIRERMKKESVPVAPVESVFDPKYQSTVKAILAELKASGMTFNNNRELKLAHGDTVHGSNIIDLIRELLVGATSPKDVRLLGWKDFMNAIAYSNLPLSIFTKGTSRAVLRKLRWEEY